MVLYCHWGKFPSIYGELWLRGFHLCWTCRNCQAEHLESLLKQSENLHFSPAIHILILQSAFTHISLNWTLIKLGHLDCQTIAPQDLTTPNKAAAKVLLAQAGRSQGHHSRVPQKLQQSQWWTNKRRNSLFLLQQNFKWAKKIIGKRKTWWFLTNIIYSSSVFITAWKNPAQERLPRAGHRNPHPRGLASARGAAEQAGDAERGDQRSLWISWQAVLRLRIFAVNRGKPLQKRWQRQV